MIPPDRELWRMAKRLVDTYGRNAIPEAARRADEFRAAGDQENAAVWDYVFGLATELLSNEPENHDREH